MIVTLVSYILFSIEIAHGAVGQGRMHHAGIV